MKKLKPIKEIIKKLKVNPSDVPFMGKYIAKLDYKLVSKLSKKKDGKLILVTAITPTRAGEGKTTVTIGLGMALAKLGKNAITCLREPSLGPVFGIKGGACGGGKSTVEPMEQINLHFTGDIHAITSAHNLLSACLDNHIYHGNKLNIDVNKIIWKRVMDMNERSLRRIKYDIRGNTINSGFEITAASEVMAILCLANSLSDLKKRLGNIRVALDKKGKEVLAKDLKIVGSMTALLRDALNPNLVQTIEGSPAIIHGGPFGNIAHGTNSIIGTRLSLKLADIVVTEAGFGADLGAEKYFGIVSRIGGFRPTCVVLVATIRALKLHGGAKDLVKENIIALREGLVNLEKQVENMRNFNINVIIAINKFSSDFPKELKFLKNICNEENIPKSYRKNICGPSVTPIVLVEEFSKGGAGVIELAKKVISCNAIGPLKYHYNLNDTVVDKIEDIAKKVYGAKKIVYSSLASSKIKNIEKKYLKLPICIAKTQSSLSDNPNLLGRPKDFSFTVTDVKIAAGAGFIVVYAGKIMTMPGLPKVPAGNKIDVNSKGEIVNLF